MHGCGHELQGAQDSRRLWARATYTHDTRFNDYRIALILCGSELSKVGENIYLSVCLHALTTRGAVICKQV